MKKIITALKITVVLLLIISPFVIAFSSLPVGENKKTAFRRFFRGNQASSMTSASGAFLPTDSMPLRALALAL